MKTIDSPISFFRRAKEILSEDTEVLKSSLETWRDYIPENHGSDRLYCCEGAFYGGEKSVLQCLACIVKDEVDRRSGIDPEKEVLFKYYRPETEEEKAEMAIQYAKIEKRTGNLPIY